MGNLIGWGLFKARVRSKVVEQNLALAYPQNNSEHAAKRKRLHSAAYSHLGNLAIEILFLLGPMRSFIRSRGVLRGVEHWTKAKEQGKGVIFLSSHVGNWEVMAATGAVWGGIDILIVTKHLKPEWLHRAIERGRLRCGVRATYEPKTLKAVLGHLKHNGTVGFVLDQYAGPPVGVRVPFFGVAVSTTTAIATLAKRTGAPVLPVVNYRDPDGRFIVEIRPPVVWQSHENPDYELAANTAAFVGELERDIYRHPEQWLWIHRRFKGDLSPLREGEWMGGRTRR